MEQSYDPSKLEPERQASDERFSSGEGVPLISCFFCLEGEGAAEVVLFVCVLSVVFFFFFFLFFGGVVVFLVCVNSVSTAESL